MFVMMLLNTLPMAGPSSERITITTTATSTRISAYSTRPWPFFMKLLNIVCPPFILGSLVQVAHIIDRPPADSPCEKLTEGVRTRQRGGKERAARPARGPSLEPRNDVAVHVADGGPKDGQDHQNHNGDEDEYQCVLQQALSSKVVLPRQRNHPPSVQDFACPAPGRRERHL